MNDSLLLDGQQPVKGQWASFLSPGLAGAMAGLYLAASASGGLHLAAGIIWAALGAGAAILLREMACWLLARRSSLARATLRQRGIFAWSIGSAILAAYLPVYLLGADHPALAPWVRWHVLAAAILAVATLHALPFVRCERGRLTERHGYIALAALVAAYIAICIALSAYRWRIFTLGNHDSAIVIQSLRYTLDEGRLLFNTLEKASHLGVHNSPIYFLLLPFYASLRRPDIFLVVLPPLAVGLSALPFYRLARPRVGVAAGLVLTAAYLLYPSLLARSVGDLYEMTLLPCLWLPAFHYYEQKKMPLFLLFLALSLAVKESIAVTALMLALYGLLRKREAPWVLAPAALGGLSLILSYGLVLPAFGGGAVSSRLAALLGPLGATPGEALLNAFRQPAVFLRAVLAPAKLALLYQLFQPLLFAPPLLSGEVTLALPALAFNLLAQGGSVGIRAWESAIFGPLLFVAAASGIRSLASMCSPKAARADLLLATAIFFATISCAPYWLRAEDYRPRAYLAAQEAAVAAIPPGAAVSAPDYMLARFAEHPYLQLQTGQPFWAEYHIVDAHWIAAVRGHRLTEEAAQQYAALVAHAERGEPYGGLRLLWARDGLYLFRREP